jgi:iron complex outermembrane receptor protein
LLLGSTLAIGLAFPLGAVAGPNDQQDHRFALPSQPLSASLRQFSDAAAEQIIFTEDLVHGIQAPPLFGAYSSNEALKILLAGTNLEAERTRSGAIMVLRAPATAPAPAEARPREGVRANPIRLAAADTTRRSAASQNDPIAQLGEVIVTARKRQESILNVPVIETAVTSRQLERMQVTQLNDLTKLVPGLSFGKATLSIGTLISLRGVGTSATDHGVDQSVSLNIDGLSLGQGIAFSSGMFDVGQVEVLKGPQALFYGKSSPGGVIALRTADPTEAREITARALYDFEARTRRGELIVSGPVSDTLRLRLATMFSASDGYFKNVAIPAPGTGALPPPHYRSPNGDNYMIRGTALWRPSSQFDARLKLNYVHDHLDDANSFQLVNCQPGNIASAGIPFVGGGEDCKLDRTLRIVGMDPAAFPGISNGGNVYLDTTQRYGTLELNYHPTSEVTLTSTTAYYNVHSKSLANSLETTYAATPLASENRFRRRDLTEEVRANSEFAGPFNFTAGGFYQDAQLSEETTSRGDTLYKLAPILNYGTTGIKIKAVSLFGQLRWKIKPRLELAGGLRWTDEKRTESPFNLLTHAPVPVPVPRLKSSKVVPEVTLTWRQTDDLTWFAAYKEANKSGSFNIGTLPSANVDNSFGDEKVRGGEVGMKSRWLDRRLTFNVAGYYYHFQGLQVGVVVPATNGLATTRTVNAGAAKTYGIDFDGTYAPPSVEGLVLNAAINWNRGRYITLNNVPCYGGQTIAMGCNQFPNAAGVFQAQNLSGTPLIRAPEWRLTWGFDYDFQLTEGYRMLFSSSTMYSTSYPAALGADRPNKDNYQRPYFKSDVSVAVRPVSDRWELALIVKNLNDEVIFGQCSIANFVNGALFGGQITGTNGRGPAGVSDIGCFTEPGREIWLRLTVRPLA